MVWGLLLGCGGSSWLRRHFPLSGPPTLPHPGLGEDIQSISEAAPAVLVAAGSSSISISLPLRSRSPDPFRDVRLTSLSFFRLSCPVSCTRPKWEQARVGGEERAGLCQVVTARQARKGFGLSVTRERRGGRGKKKFLFRIEGRKVPKMGLFVT